MVLVLTRDVRQRMAAAMALVDGGFSLARETVSECEQRRKLAIALAGRFVCRGWLRKLRGSRRSGGAVYGTTGCAGKANSGRVAFG